MSNNSFNQISAKQTMTSMQIAEITGKNHFDVLKAIRKMEPAWEKEAASKFTCSEYKDKSGKSNPIYILTKTECLFVATKFNDQARARLVLRWEQLEQERAAAQPTMPERKAYSRSEVSNWPDDPSKLTRKQILLMAIEAEEEAERLRSEKEELELENYSLMVERGEQERQIEHLQQRVSYLDIIDRQRDTLNTTQVAQDYGYTAVAFNQLLNGLRIQYNSGGQWVLYAPYISCGYVANRQVEIQHSNGHKQYKQLTVWTPLGRHFLYETLKKKGILPLVERLQQQQSAAAEKKGGAA